MSAVDDPVPLPAGATDSDTFDRIRSEMAILKSQLPLLGALRGLRRRKRSTSALSGERHISPLAAQGSGTMRASWARSARAITPSNAAFCESQTCPVR